MQELTQHVELTTPLIKSWMSAREQLTPHFTGSSHNRPKFSYEMLEARHVISCVCGEASVYN